MYFGVIWLLSGFCDVWIGVIQDLEFCCIVQFLYDVAGCCCFVGFWDLWEFSCVVSLLVLGFTVCGFSMIYGVCV